MTKKCCEEQPHTENQKYRSVVCPVVGPYVSLCSVDIFYFCSTNAPHKKLPAPIGSIVEPITFGNVCIHVPTTKIPFCSLEKIY